ncbi:hypothetical protein BANRA_04435 [Klebsiella pneumoniae]|nr:hypothetical protein BANRA_04435 [Klebsiella pneumoniae]
MNKVLFICVVYATQPEKTITLNSLANIKFEKIILLQVLLFGIILKKDMRVKQ